METIWKRAFPNWSQAPIPRFELSAAGLLALADLGTIAQRTAIVGGSSWLDSLLLAPGLHYQQAADALTGEAASYSAIEIYQGKSLTYSITNPATIRYLQRLVAAAGSAGHKVVVDVGSVTSRRSLTHLSAPSAPGGDRRMRRRGREVGQRAIIWADPTLDVKLGWLSHLLYLAAPALTVCAFVFMILLQEWWGIALLAALMFSRLLNIWVIKQRAQEPVWTPGTPHQNPGSPTTSPTSPSSPASPASSSHPDLGDLLTEYVVDLGHGRTASLRGLASDLKAITEGPWLATKTHVQGYLEAIAKLTVYLVAALSGNMTQAGNLIFMALLLVTAGLLGLSNAHAKTLRMRGRIAAPTSTDRLPETGSSGPEAGTHPATWPPSNGDAAAASRSPNPGTGRRGGGGGGGRENGRDGGGRAPPGRAAPPIGGGWQDGTVSNATGSPLPDTASWADSTTWPPTTTRTSTDASGLENFVRRV